MDGATELDAAGVGPRVLRLFAGSEPEMTPARVAELLGRWQQREVRIAQGFDECGGLSVQQVEDLYQETMLALLHRPYQSERHLRNALRQRLKQRALNLYRDERRREEILAENALGIHVLEAARSAEEGPESSALLDQDRLIANEFRSELTLLERRVFRRMAEGMKFHSIAKDLGISVNEARNATRACERKRERFQALYESGRLCGFRAETIRALQAGQETNDELAARAFAHLEACAHCRAEHHTNAQRLRRAFQGQAAALLPAPLIVHLGWLARAGLRARGLQQKAAEVGALGGAGGVRERAGVLLAGGGAGVKIAAGIVATVVVAGSTIGATNALEHPRAHHQQPHRLPTPSPPVRAAVSLLQSRLATQLKAPPQLRHKHRTTPGRVVPAGRVARAGLVTQHEPGGFAYLGVPTPKPPAKTVEPARTAGGPFSP